LRIWRCATLGINRVMRGGSWNNNPQNCRASNRNNNGPENSNNNIGFRLARSSSSTLVPDGPFWGRMSLSS
jgi:hypothetical protein